jgi:hypothetical protein
MKPIILQIHEGDKMIQATLHITPKTTFSCIQGFINDMRKINPRLILKGVVSSGKSRIYY